MGVRYASGRGGAAKSGPVVPLSGCCYRKGCALRSLAQPITIPSYFKKGVDAERQNEDTNFRCETRRYLSWIEGLTTNQYVGGSNPSRRTIELQKLANRRAFLLPYACLASMQARIPSTLLLVVPFPEESPINGTAFWPDRFPSLLLGTWRSWSSGIRKSA